LATFFEPWAGFKFGKISKATLIFVNVKIGKTYYVSYCGHRSKNSNDMSNVNVPFKQSMPKLCQINWRWKYKRQHASKPQQNKQENVWRSSKTGFLFI